VTVRQRTPLLLLCGMASLSAAALARAPRATEPGHVVYAARCAACHGRNFEGDEDAPALVGARFEAKWRGQAARLRDKISRSMPQDDPGSLSPAQASDVTALILTANRMPLPPRTPGGRSDGLEAM